MVSLSLTAASQITLPLTSWGLTVLLWVPYLVPQGTFFTSSVWSVVWEQRKYQMLRDWAVTNKVTYYSEFQMPLSLATCVSRVLPLLNTNISHLILCYRV
jgi:hypothetical protein